jgi:hypothetical protein
MKVEAQFKISPPSLRASRSLPFFLSVLGVLEPLLLCVENPSEDAPSTKLTHTRYYGKIKVGLDEKKKKSNLCSETLV